MAQTIQLRGGTAAEWFAANPILAHREMGVVTDTQNYKIGDGVTAWNDLPAFQLSPELGAITLNAITDPSASATDKLSFYAKNVAGRMMPKWKGPSGLDTMAQPSFANNGIIIYAPSTTTSLTVFGAPAPAATGTRSHPVMNDSSLRTSIRRWNVTSAATAASAAYERTTTAFVIRGSQPGMGGFFFVLRFALPSILAEKAVAMALHSNTNMASVTVPSTQLNHITLGTDTNDTNLQLMHNDNIGVSTKINLGADFPKNNVNAVYELVLFCPPNGSSIFWRVMRLDTGATAEGELTSDLPAAGVGLAPQMLVHNVNVAASVQMDLIRMYLESDY